MAGINNHMPVAFEYVSEYKGIAVIITSLPHVGVQIIDQFQVYLLINIRLVLPVNDFITARVDSIRNSFVVWARCPDYRLQR